MAKRKNQKVEATNEAEENKPDEYERLLKVERLMTHMKREATLNPSGPVKYASIETQPPDDEPDLRIFRCR